MDDIKTITPAIPELGDILTRAVAAKLTPEFVEAAVDKHVNKLIAETIEDSLKSWGDTGKEIKRAVGEALRVNRLDLPSYGQIIEGMLQAQIEQIVHPLIAGRLKEDMADLLHLAPAEVKLSYIAEKMIEGGHHGEDAYGDLITVTVERTDYGFTHIYLDDENAGTTNYRCPFQIDLDKDGKIYAGKAQGRDLKAVKEIGTFYGVGQLIRAYVACGTKIIVDEDDVVRGIGDY